MKQGVQTVSHRVMPQAWWQPSWTCPDCGKNIIAAGNGVEKHKPHCVKHKYIHVEESKCKYKGRVYVFYDKGSIHCFNCADLSRYLKMDKDVLRHRLHKNKVIWSMNQILGKEPPPKDHRLDKSFDGTIYEKKTMSGKEALKQKLLSGL